MSDQIKKDIISVLNDHKDVFLTANQVHLLLMVKFPERWPVDLTDPSGISLNTTITLVAKLKRLKDYSFIKHRDQYSAR